jgi:chemotaxis response regulator CheB
MPIRALIVDHDPGFVEVLRTALADSQAVKVVGSANDGAEALQLVEELAPEVVTMDLDMPRLEGVEATSLVLERYPGTVVVLVSGSENHAKDEIEEEILAAASQHRPLRFVHV